VLLPDLDGHQVDPFQTGGNRALVFLFARTDCPISNRYAPEVRRIWERYSSKNVPLWLVYPDPHESPSEIRQHLDEYQYPCPALRDPERKLVELTGVKVTPEVAVFLPNGEMVYRGRISDWYVAYGKARVAPAHNDLEEVLDAILAGKRIDPSTTKAVGCPIEGLDP
jgi:hypothetical protein